MYLIIIHIGTYIILGYRICIIQKAKRKKLLNNFSLIFFSEDMSPSFEWALLSLLIYIIIRVAAKQLLSLTMLNIPDCVH